MYLYELLSFAQQQIDSENVFVTPCNMLPDKFKLPAGFIVNLSKSTEQGTHWVSLAIDSKKKGILLFWKNQCFYLKINLFFRILL